MKVEYNGVTLNLPDWARFIATDTDGRIGAFSHKPVYNREMGWLKTKQMSPQQFTWNLPKVSPPKDAKSTLMEIK